MCKMVPNCNGLQPSNGLQPNSDGQQNPSQVVDRKFICNLINMGVNRIFDGGQSSAIFHHARAFMGLAIPCQ